MNILQVGSYLYPDLVGGAEISAQNIYVLLKDAGHDVVRLRSAKGHFSRKTLLRARAEGEWQAESWRPCAPIVQARAGPKALFYAMEFFARVDRQRLRSLIAEERIDAVIVHSFRGIGYDLLTALAEINLPTLFFLHDLAIVCINKSMVRGGRLCESPCPQCRMVQSISRDALARMDRVCIVGPSAQIVKRVSAQLSIPELMTKHIPNPNRYAITPRLRGLRDQPFTVGFVGRLDIEKGLAGLLPIMDRLAQEFDLRFLIVGAGHMEEEVISFAAHRPWVDFRGFVEPQHTPAVYDAIDVLALPSLWPENFPGVAVQAIASGCPVVGFSIGGIPEIVEDNVSGRLIPFSDFETFGAALAEILSDDSKLTALSRGAIDRSKCFDPDLLAAQLLKLIEDVVRGPSFVG